MKDLHCFNEWIDRSISAALGGGVGALAAAGHPFGHMVFALIVWFIVSSVVVGVKAWRQDAC